MKKTHDQEQEKNQLLFHIKKFYRPISNCNGSVWLNPNGNMIWLNKHSEIEDDLSYILSPEKIEKIKGLDEYSSETNINHYFAKLTDSIRVRCERDNLSIELLEEQEQPTIQQEKTIKNLLCDGKFKTVYLDIVSPFEKKNYWDGGNDSSKRKFEGRSIQEDIDIEKCEKIGDDLIQNFAQKQHQDLSELED